MANKHGVLSIYYSRIIHYGVVICMLEKGRKHNTTSINTQ